MVSSRGALIVKALAVYHSSSCRGTHTNMLLVPQPSILRNPIRILRTTLGFMGLPGGYSKREIDYLKETQNFGDKETGYQQIQGSKPQVRNVQLSCLN